MNSRFGTLQEQALGAFISHAKLATLPLQQILDALAAFQQNPVHESTGARGRGRC